jgi:hypothetical protein
MLAIELIGPFSIVENVNMKSYVQATRHMVYTVFDSLLALHRQGKRVGVHSLGQGLPSYSAQEHGFGIS